MPNNTDHIMYDRSSSDGKSVVKNYVVESYTTFTNEKG